MSTFTLKPRNEVTIKLSQADLIQLENVNRDQVLYPKARRIVVEKSINEKLVDAAIKKGLIQPYEKTILDHLTLLLKEICELEYSIKRCLYDANRDSISYFEICKTVSDNPSVVHKFNQIISDQGVYFAESWHELKPYRSKDNKPLNDLSGFSEDQLSEMISAAEKVLADHKE